MFLTLCGEAHHLAKVPRDIAKAPRGDHDVACCTLPRPLLFVRLLCARPQCVLWLSEHQGMEAGRMQKGRMDG